MYEERSMTEFRYMNGVVYILENSEAKRVKVGMTINDVKDRLQDVNEKWLGVKATCQICGGRRLLGRDGNIPTHVLSGRRCQGSGSLPFEKDSALAESYLSELKKNLGHERRILTLEKRIEQFRKFDKLVGEWRIVDGSGTRVMSFSYGQGGPSSPRLRSEGA